MSAAARIGIAVAMSALSACGTTVTMPYAQQSGALPPDGLAAPSLAAPGSVQQDPTLGGLQPDGSSAAAGSSTAPGRELSQSSVEAAPRTAGAGVVSEDAVRRNGPGVTDTTVTIGVTYYQNAQAANAALGAGGVEAGDPVAGTKALVADINKRGGIAGRKVEVLFWSFDPQSPQPYAAAGQEMCTHFTEDNKVFVVIDGAPAAGKEARGCLADRGVMYQGASLVTTGDLVPGEVDVTSLTFDRLFAALPGGLKAQGWFGGWDHVRGAPAPSAPTEIGVLTVDNPPISRAVDRVLLPTLKAAGHPVNPDNVVRLAKPGGSSDNGSVAAAIHGAVLKFRSNGVGHVILTDANGSMSLLFQNDAFSQGYFPRYGGSSGNGWQVLLDGGAIQSKTLVGAMGLGWQPLLDLPYASGDGPYSSAARKACFAVFRAAGQPHQSGSTAGGQAAACDITYFLSRVLADHRGPVDRDLVLALTSGLGTAYPSAATVGTRFDAGKRDGAGAYYVMAYRSDCTCFGYAGPRRAL